MRDKREEAPRRHSKDLACTALGAAQCRAPPEGAKKRMQIPGPYDDGRKVNLSQPRNGPGGRQMLATVCKPYGDDPLAGSRELAQMGRSKLVNDVRSKDGLHPACRPVPVGRVRGVGAGGKLWALELGGGSAAAGESRLSVGVSSRAAEDQDRERRAQLGGEEAGGSRGPKLCNATTDICNVLGAWHLSANAATLPVVPVVVRVPACRQASRAGVRVLHAHKLIRSVGHASPRKKTYPRRNCLC